MRRGVTLLELTAATALAAALAAVVLESVRSTAASRRSSDLRRVAMVELSNRMEELRGRPASDLTPATLGALRPSPEWLARSPGSRLAATIETQTDPPMRKLTLELRYPAPGGGGSDAPPVRLAAWLRREEAP